MKPIHVLLLVIVAAAATLVYFFTREGAPPAEQAGAPATREAPAAPSPAKPAVEKPAETVAAPADRTSAPVAADRDYDDEETKLPVSNTVVGRVLNAQEQGVPNARVQLSKDAFMGESITLAFFAGREVSGVVLETTTDAQGSYKFVGVDPGREYFVMATHAEYAQVQEEGLHVGRQGEFRAPDLVMRQGSRLRGYVTNVEGDALSNAEVHLDSAYMMDVEVKSPDRLTAKTNDQGFYEFKNIAQGPRVLTCTSDGYANHTLHGLMFQGDGADIVEKNIRLNIGHFLQGRVFGPQGEGVANAKVIAMNYGANTQSRGEALTDEDGAFLVEGLDVGSYIVMVQAQGYRPEKHTRVQVDDLNVQIPMLKQAELTGRVLEQNSNKPLGKFKVRLLQVAVGIPQQGNQLQYENTQISAEAAPAGDGSFVMPGVNPGTYAVKVTANGYASRVTDTFQVVDGLNTPPMTIYLSKGGAVSGRLVDSASGRGVVGAQVSTHDGDVPASQMDPFFENLGASRATERKIRSKEDGLFEIGNLTPGRYRLKIDHPDFTVEWVENVVVEEGQIADAGAVSLKPGGSLVGKVIEASGKPCSRGMVRMFHELTGDMYQARTDAQGRYSIPHVKPGAYRVSATRASGAGVDAFDALAEQQQSEITVQVSEGQELQRDLQLGN